MQLNSQILESIFTLSRIMKEQMSYDSELVHLSLLQLQVLIYLKKNPSSQMTDIANAFKIELPSATSLITKLTKLKLVSRKTDPKDRRFVRISITVTGDSLLQKAMKTRSEKVTSSLEYLSEEEKKSLLSILQKVIIKMEGKNEK